jgi:isopentenyl-diphosphate delta-isomerase
VGVLEKLTAHHEGHLHRAFSIFIFNSKKELLIHQRNPLKYHSGGLWTNTCCGHPRPNEKTIDAAKRRLMEEMGFVCDLKKEFDFTYFVKFNNGLSENEFDHVFTGVFDGIPRPNPAEVSDYKWINWDILNNDVYLNPEKYTYWFKECLQKFKQLNYSY